MFTWAGIKEWGSWALEWGLEMGSRQWARPPRSGPDRRAQLQGSCQTLSEC